MKLLWPDGPPWRKEVIGKPECPILYRWTLADFGERGFKLMVHRFLPETRDRDYHDHPRSFVTCVVRGAYEDHRLDSQTGAVFSEWMKPGTIRLRTATHAHKTFASRKGAWTIVVMGPLKRKWGFFVRRDVEGSTLYRWLPFRRYEAEIGHGMRCGDE